MQQLDQILRLISTSSRLMQWIMDLLMKGTNASVAKVNTLLICYTKTLDLNRSLDVE